jgi:hypothetical protein
MHEVRRARIWDPVTETYTKVKRWMMLRSVGMTGNARIYLGLPGDSIIHYQQNIPDLLIEAREDGWMIHVHLDRDDRIGGLMISDDGTATYTPERN